MAPADTLTVALQATSVPLGAVTLFLYSQCTQHSHDPITFMTEAEGVHAIVKLIIYVIFTISLSKYSSCANKQMLAQGVCRGSSIQRTHTHTQRCDLNDTQTYETVLIRGNRYRLHCVTHTSFNIVRLRSVKFVLLTQTEKMSDHTPEHKPLHAARFLT